MGASQHLHVQHVGHDHVAGITQTARDLARRIEAPDIIADVGRACTIGLERCRRQLAGNHVPGDLDRLEYLGITGAAADVAAEALLDLLDARIGVLAQGRCRRHHHAGNAVAALAGAGLVKGPLHRCKLAGRCQPLDGLDPGPVRLSDRHEAGLDQLAVDEHRTGAALTGAAAFLGAGQVEVVAQEVEQPQMRRGPSLHRPAIDFKLEFEFRH